jgi:hypothetical protein
MGGSRRQGKKDATEDVGGQLLLNFGLLEGLLPIGRSEFEQAVPGPAGHEAQLVAQVGERLDPVQPALASRETKTVFTRAPSSLPTKSQLRRPRTWRLRFNSLMLFVRGSRPSSRKRRSAMR